MKHSAAMVALCAAFSVGLGFAHPFGNPRVAAPNGGGELLMHATMPADAKRALISKCADCHSNETRWPTYSRVAPGSWLIERDIIEARKKMNLSLWDQMAPDEQEQMIGKIVHEAKSGAMPPLQYRILHWGSRITPLEITALSRMQTGASAQPEAHAVGDAARGKVVFQKRCTGCHALEGNREGPPLAGVFGRRAGSVAGFNYSPGLKVSGITWKEATLEKWLTDPDMVVPNNKMGVDLPKAQERSDVIAYFEQK